MVTKIIFSEPNVVSKQEGNLIFVIYIQVNSKYIITPYLEWSTQQNHLYKESRVFKGYKGL